MSVLEQVTLPHPRLEQVNWDCCLSLICHPAQPKPPYESSVEVALPEAVAEHRLAEAIAPRL